jgi:hypothetical protein
MKTVFDIKKSLIKTFALYQRRWDIENYGFRELKGYWNIEKLPGKKFNSVYMHIFLTLVMFNTVIAYKSNRKDKFVSKEFLLLMDLPPPSEEAVIRIIQYPQDKGKIW